MADSDKIVAYYEQGVERDRLLRGAGRLELARTQEILRRHLPPPPASVLDVGGAVGVYAEWLASEGYAVHLVDLVPDHVERARSRGGFTATVGDARALPAAEASFDAVLLFGPLYHLLDPGGRVLALREAARVSRGLVAAAYISRWAPMLDGLQQGWIYDEVRAARVEEVIGDGRVRLPDDVGAGFGAIGYFHRPDEIRDEVAAAGFELVDLVGVEGPGCWLADIDARWEDPDARHIIMRMARVVEREPALMCMSQHLLAVARAR
jgi:SAM-dependent methyltransferase